MPSPDYQDDPEISDSDVVYRRVSSERWVWAEGRPISGEFSDSQDGTPMSVALGSLLEANGLTAEAGLAGHPGYGLVSVSVRLVRQFGLGVAVRPPVAGRPAHGWVIGKKTKSIQRRLAKQCAVAVAPIRSE